ncbi:Na+/H+ antiporter subunit E [Pseudonocardia phyllosphaerae]|uniref:Na+/H+ antiporter subunit E n=1 Tax=Pseudonocardia phyllosphaerae TaxID=3390502 RepID=UPI0039782FBE
MTESQHTEPQHTEPHRTEPQHTEPQHTDAHTGTAAGEAPEPEETPEGCRERDIAAVETGTDPEPGAGPHADEAPAATGGSARDTGRAYWRRIPQVVALTVVWVLLWGSPKPVTIAGGLVVALVVTALFPLPLMPEPLPVRPLRVLRLFGYLLWDLLVSGVRVAMVTLRYGRKAHSGIVSLPMCAGSDRTTTAIALACALSPGSFVLQIDRRRGRWYAYVLGLEKPGSVDRARRDMLTLQLRVVQAVGTAEDQRCAREALEAVGTPPAGTGEKSR